MKLIRVMLDYVHPWPNAAGFYMARRNGLYAQLGLDVSLSTYDYGRGDTLAHLERGDVDFGVFPPNRLLVRRELGQPVVGLAAINQTGLETIQVTRASGIADPGQIAGRRITYAPTPRGKALVGALIEAAGGDPAAAVIVDSGDHELTPEYLLASGAEAMFGGYWCWDALTDAVPDGEVITWPVPELAGAPLYHSYLLGSHERLLADDPELVRGFLAATAAGYAQALDDLPSTTALLVAALPYLPAWKLTRSLTLVASSWCHDGHWGVLRDSHVAGYARWLTARGVLRDADVAAAAVTTEFLPETSATTRISGQAREPIGAERTPPGVDR